MGLVVLVVLMHFGPDCPKVPGSSEGPDGPKAPGGSGGPDGPYVSRCVGRS